MSATDDEAYVWTPAPVATPASPVSPFSAPALAASTAPAVAATEPELDESTPWYERPQPTYEELLEREAKYPQPESIAPCHKCGFRHVTMTGHVSCTAHKSSDNRFPCHAYSVSGLRVCRSHGGGNSASVRKSKRVVAAKAAQTSLAEVGISPIGHPIDELAELAAEVIAVKDHFADLVGLLNDQYRFTDDKGAEQLDARVALYERALDRCQKVLTELARVGFEEQRLRLDEGRAALVFTFVQGFLRDLQLSIDAPPVRQALERWSPVLDGADVPNDIIDGEIIE